MAFLKACLCPAVVKQEVERTGGEAESILEIPGVSVVIINARKGQELPVIEGPLRFVVMAAPSNMCLLFVGNKFGNTKEGFYFPLMAETPVCLTSDTVLTMDAQDGDVFGVRLPQKSAAKVAQLARLLDESCTFVDASKGSRPPGKLERVGAAMTKPHNSSNGQYAGTFGSGEAMPMAAMLRDGLTKAGQKAVDQLRDPETQAALMSAAVAIGTQVAAVAQKRAQGGTGTTTSGSTTGAPPAAAARGAATGRSSTVGVAQRAVQNEAAMDLLINAGQWMFAAAQGAAAAGSAGTSRGTPVGATGRSPGAASAQPAAGDKAQAMFNLASSAASAAQALLQSPETRELAQKAARYTADGLLGVAQRSDAWSGSARR